MRRRRMRRRRRKGLHLRLQELQAPLACARPQEQAAVAPGGKLEARDTAVDLETAVINEPVGVLRVPHDVGVPQPNCIDRLVVRACGHHQTPAICVIPSNPHLGEAQPANIHNLFCQIFLHFSLFHLEWLGVLPPFSTRRNPGALGSPPTAFSRPSLPPPLSNLHEGPPGKLSCDDTPLLFPKICGSAL